MSAKANPEPMLPTSVGELRDILDLLEDDATIDINFDGRVGYIYYATVNEDFSGKLHLLIQGTEE